MKQKVKQVTHMQTLPDSKYDVSDSSGMPSEDMCCYARNSKTKIVWQITDNCPLNCQYCFTPNRGRSDLSIDDAKTLLQTLRYRYPEKHLLLFAGREPLLYNDLEQVVKCACELKFTCSMSTSGERLSLERAKQLRDSGLRKVNLSINAFDHSLHKKTRPYGELSKVLGAINSSLAVGFVVKVNVTITKQTIDLLPDTIQSLVNEGVHSVTVGLLHSVPNQSTDICSWQYNIIKDIRNTVKNCVPKGYDFRLIIPPGPQDCFTHDNCPIRSGLVSILPDGSITGCNIYPDVLKGRTASG